MAELSRLTHDPVASVTSPGKLVPDPRAGVGSTGVAALELGRRFIGVELDAHYAQIARQRLGQAARPAM